MRITLNVRFALLLGVLFVFFLGGVALLNSTHDSEVERGLQAAQRERNQLLGEIISLTGYPLQQFTKDYSLWDEMVAFVQQPDAQWAQINLEASLTTFRLRSIWVLGADGTSIYTVSSGDNRQISSPVLPADLPRLRAADPFTHFYATVDGATCEVFACPIQPSADTRRTSAPVGWLVAATLWDTSHLETLDRLSGGTSSLAPGDASATPYRSGGSFEVIRPLLNLAGLPHAALRTTYRPPALESAEIFNREELLIFVLQGLILIAVAALCIHVWIARPIKGIIASLRADDSAPIAHLAHHDDEIGLIARLVRSHFADRAALQRNERALNHTLAERVRLGRDLHDNVIQALFATGMGITAIKNLIRTSPHQVEAGLETVRTNLNDVIREVRTFIVGLEPSSLEGKSFSQAISDLADALRSIRTVQIETDIDETAEQTLPPDLRRHALQLTRETLLNNIRHAGATRLQLSLRLANNQVELSLIDDGSRVALSDNNPAGRGLVSLIERAALVGASCEINPTPDRGNYICIRYPLPNTIS